MVKETNNSISNIDEVSGWALAQSISYIYDHYGKELNNIYIHTATTLNPNSATGISYSLLEGLHQIFRLLERCGSLVPVDYVGRKAKLDET